MKLLAIFAELWYNIRNMFMKRGAALSELQTTLFGTGDKSGNTEELAYKDEISGQVTIDDAYEPDFTEENDDETASPTPEELIRDSMSAVERMKKEIAQENENLDRRFSAHRAQVQAQPAAKKRPTYVIGVLSAAASLIFMGVALLISVCTSPIGAYAAIKLAPVMLVFLGAEIIFAVIRKSSLRIKIDLRSIIVITGLLILSSVLSVVSVVASAGTGERIYAEQRIQNMLASELHDTIAEDYIKSVDIETQLFGEDAEMYNTPADLTDGDIINLKVNFSDASMTIREFAKDCKQIINNLHKLQYNFGTINFVAEDMVNRYELDIDWHYQSDFDADRLASLVNYFGDGISDVDIPDAYDEEE